MRRDTCEGSLHLEMSWLRKNRYLEGFRSGFAYWKSNRDVEQSVGITVDLRPAIPGISFHYVQTSREGVKTTFDYSMVISSIPCRFGGRRYYFQCPLSRNGVFCNRRVGVVYLCGKWFGCRRCHDLAYESQQHSRRGGPGGIFKYWGLAMDLEDRTEKIRVKFWKGRPTKRYLRLLWKYRRLDALEPAMEAFNQKFLRAKNEGRPLTS